jgi:hypothetical protein
MRFLLGLLFCAGLILEANAQRACGVKNQNNTYSSSIVRSSSKVFGPARDTIVNEIITIPVVVHVLYNTQDQNISDDQIISQIEVLNRDYRRLNADTSNTPLPFRAVAADARIMFCLAKVAPDGRSTSGIVRRHTNNPYFLLDDGMKFDAAGGADAWDPAHYLNIWVCSMMGRALGYSSLPGDPAETDGVVINYDVFGSRGNLRAPYTLGRTATHEVGHWLGLKHIWGDANCGSDDVDDTPTQSSYNYNCPNFPKMSACSPNANGDMFMNYMDLTSDACMNIFTHGQKQRMRSLFALGHVRNSFLNSYECDGGQATGGPLPSDSATVNEPTGGISVYPNPVLNKTTVSPTGNFSLANKSVYVYNTLGEKVWAHRFYYNIEQVDLSKLPAGVYIMVCGEGKDRIKLKILKL